ncbi:MAG: hypothetical protein IPI99_13895 [Saprospiraceae bacterium]|nr:hypothetical protein [Saprospiraceae bacterium]
MQSARLGDPIKLVARIHSKHIISINHIDKRYDDEWLRTADEANKSAITSKRDARIGGVPKWKRRCGGKRK